jgi:acetoin utilization protein AcuB
MKIKSLMIPDPITITEKANIQQAIEIMKTNSIRHLPVVGGQCLKAGDTGRSQVSADSFHGSWPFLADVMITNQSLSIRTAISRSRPQLIYKYKMSVSCSEKAELVGIITESDLLRAFVDMWVFCIPAPVSMWLLEANGACSKSTADY